MKSKSMNSSKRLFGKPYFAPLVCKDSETFHEKNASFLPHCDWFCFYHVMNDHPPLARPKMRCVGAPPKWNAQAQIKMRCARTT